MILGFERAMKVDAEGSTVRFKGVDSSVSTLTVSAYDADVPLGSGTGHDVALLCKFDPMKPAGKAVKMINVAIVLDIIICAPRHLTHPQGHHNPCLSIDTSPKRRQ